MNKSKLVMLMIVLPFTAWAQSLDDLKGKSSDGLKGLTDSISESAGGSLSGMLSSGLGISEDQADASMGSVLALAGEKLSSGEYDSLINKIPGADKYLDSAKSAGALAGKIGDVDALKNSLSGLGIPPETVDKMLPMIVEYGGKLGGEKTQGLLQKVLGS